MIQNRHRGPRGSGECTVGLYFKMKTSLQILWSHLFREPYSNEPFLTVFPHSMMSILPENTAWVTVSEIHLFAFLAPNMLCPAWKLGPRHPVCSSPDSLSCPFPFLLLTSFSRYQKRNVWNWASPRKTPAATTLLLQLKKSHHLSIWHTPTVFGKKNKWLNGRVVHIPLSEGSNFTRESVSPYFKYKEAEKKRGEIEPGSSRVGFF